MTMIAQSPIPAQLAERMTNRRPHLRGMAAKSLALVERGAVTLIDDRSGTVTNGGGHTYNVCLADDGPRCDCPAWQYRPVIINDHWYCKHTVALILALNAAGGELTDEPAAAVRRQRRMDDDDDALIWEEMVALYGDTDEPDHDDAERRDILRDCGIG